MNRRQVIIGGSALTLAGVSAAYIGIRRTGTLEDYNTAVAEMRSPLPVHPQAEEWVRFATLAASSHNTQPWRFQIREDRIEILPDFARRTPAVDPDDHHLFVSLGCAAENLALAAQSQGHPGDINFGSANGGSISYNYGLGRPAESVLFDAIQRRQSTRAEYDGRAVSAAEIQTLKASAVMPGVDCVLMSDRTALERSSELVMAGNSAQMADRAYVRELKSWLRFNPRQAIKAGDGLFTASTGNPTMPTWLGQFSFDWLLQIDAENDKYARQIRSSAGVAIFAAQQADPKRWVQVGRACQRFALQATALGLKHAFINQPVEVSTLRADLAALVGMTGRRPDIVMRFGYGPMLPFSPRRPVKAVLA